MQRLKVSKNKRFLCLKDGSPFFWQADTGWEMFHNFSLEDAREYFEIRKKQEFNVVQAVILAEFDGLDKPNFYGRRPLLKNSEGQYDPTMPDLDGEYSYFDHVDALIKMAKEYGIYIALLPTWGDKWNLEWGIGPEIFNPDNAYTYGKFVGERYKDYDNIVWIMGGDRAVKTEEHSLILRNMAKGIKDGGATQIMTLHPMGGHSSTEFVNDEDWLDFNMIQSGHGERITKSDIMITHDYNTLPIRPALDGEPNYEDHPVAFSHIENGFFDDTDVRRASYYAVFSGSLGITYGHHSVWPMRSKSNPMDFSTLGKPYYHLNNTFDALDRPGANQIKHLKNLMLSRSFFDRVPYNQVIAQPLEGSMRQCATKGEKYILVYCTFGLPCKLDLTEVNSFTASWYNVKNGETTAIGHFDGGKVMEFKPLVQGRNEDCVLIIDMD
ncbi:MAG: glycoside hydrolase family 140 protein [Clostridia bacterium]|nr:glycoside hydrolase family 140 protein [Clostridia bacterium]